ncbi:alpha-ketoglutarate-dependent dioxygenase AlkB family protein [Marinobacterium sedimentorum]|uniref:alpha-ketoglutarate-dependent dioxygenase AlkB family protein n=1 Tax=Marinobacterium sedimentorum TaxID=2927804 RepID=UPI0020C6F20B|nr:alpha-ketoglutarate-dependent dioxygenase AlkB [Marinobacterium sedimentorum]MCP8687960.1 alpha-ketoglutarate-dependent dioxygenase AlkB [Marinobacterium sedimentorum]
MQPEHIRAADAELVLYRRFIAPPDSARLLAALDAGIQWRQDRIRLFGREHAIPRLQQFQGEPGLHYRYSGLLLETKPWHPLIEQLRRRIKALEPAPFNCVLLNLYRDGNDSMGWHSDDEPELGPNPVIASLSLGQPRRFVLRHRQDRQQPKIELLLDDGSLLLMRGSTQHHWQHALPRTRSICRPRLNLTFRCISD